ncbi:cytochrome P450 [Nonomuraea endophytica]|uniref:Cytochrome P450 n=1 Tax=Nonomuraea endophytica TaxID=714136 RepID=A0A7W8AGL0_9ACTN|nr:cytochrome P450 [Nonomuraea endophytica]MBB5084741.1 cytochrome P450 [Nonomuraea endophytica]
MTELLFNPFEPGFTDDPYPAYRRLRESEPVHESPFGFWVLSGYEDIAGLLRAGLSVDDRKLDPGPVRDQRDQLVHAGDNVLGMSMLDRDPPDHTRLRSLVGKVFTPRKVAALEPEITALVDSMLDEIQAAGRVDLMATLAFPLPFAVISKLLGMPAADHARIRDLSGLLVRTLEPVADQDLLAQVSKAGGEMTQVIREALAWKRTHPAEDLLTALIAAEQDGDRLSDDELIAQVALLYIAGHETTMNLIANGVTALLRNPAQLALLRERPELAGNAIEEFLRFDSPVQQTRRITLEPYTVGGRTIPPRAFVLACLASANRDVLYWGQDAEELRIEREQARNHISFGAGAHYCLGPALARLEGRVAIERLVSRFPALSFDGEVEMNGRMNLRGPERLPISV